MTTDAPARLESWARAGRAAAALIQGAVVALHAWPLAAAALGGIASPLPVPMLGTTALFAGGPSLVLLVALLAAGRRAVWFGLGLGATSAAPQLLLLSIGAGWWPVLPWLATVAALVPTALLDWRAGPRWLSAAASGAAGVAVAALPFAFMMAVLTREVATRGGRAPDAPAPVRRVWGEGIYGAYLTRIDAWARESPAVARDLGAVRDVVPVGAPNYYHGCFTDGCYAAMNLEVVGERGTGVLLLPYVNIYSDGTIVSVGEARWTRRGRSDLMMKSGETFLREKGLDQAYEAFLASSEAGRHAEAVRVATELNPDDSLPWVYRREVLPRLAVSMDRIGRRNDATSTLLTLVRARFARVERAFGSGSVESAPPELRATLDDLRRAREFAPTEAAVSKLARKRVELERLAAAGGVRWPPRDGEEARRQWGRRTLGLFYDEAVRFAERAAAVRRDVGSIRGIAPDPNGLSEVRVEDSGHYSAAVFLEVRGSSGKGRLLVRLRENRDELAPVDLFADAPRAPDYPLKLSSPAWTLEGGREVELSAKTGEPSR